MIPSASRAGYGKRVIEALSESLTNEYGREFSRTNLGHMRQFYLACRERESEIRQFRIGELAATSKEGIPQFEIGESSRLPERTHRPFRLSRTHCLTPMHIEDPAERDFYEREAIENNWDSKTPRCQYGSSLYGRLLFSRNKQLLQKKLAEWLEEEEGK